MHTRATGRPGAFSPIAVSGLALMLLLAASCGDSQAQSEPAEGTGKAAQQGQPDQPGEPQAQAGGSPQSAGEKGPRKALGTLVSGQQAAPDVLHVVDEIIRLSTPLDPTLTSDHHDRHFKAYKELRERLIARPDYEVGIACLQAYVTEEQEVAEVRRSLMTHAAHSAPEESRELLLHLMLTYGFSIDDRTEATVLLAQTSPEIFLEAAEDIIKRRGRATETRPDDEWFIRGWVIACDLTGRSPVPELADIVTNLVITDIGRHYAAEALGNYPDLIGRMALETALVESSGNGYLRRKAAQALLKSVSREEACALFEKVFIAEADTNMALFLKSMIETNCR